MRIGKIWQWLFLLILAFGPQVHGQFTLPKPSGPHGVGTLHISFESNYKSPLATVPDETGRHYAQVWYPTGEVSRDKATYWPQASTSSVMLTSMFGMPAGSFSNLETVLTNSLLNASVLEKSEPFPVVLFAHGYSFWPTQNTVLMEELASQGFVVFSLSFAYESAYQITNDELTVYRFDHAPLTKRWQEIFDSAASDFYAKRKFEKDEVLSWELEKTFLSMQQNLQESARHWQKEIGLWIDHLSILQESHPLLKTRLDLGKIATVGHSFGGSAAVLSAYKDKRIKASVNMDGAQYGLNRKDQLSKPIMFLYSDSKVVDINHIYYSQSAGDYYSVSVANTGHLNFCDMPFFAPFLVSTDLVGNASQSVVSRQINTAVLRFLRKYLETDQSQSVDLDLPGLKYHFKKASQ